ncbi:hypothetical protein CGH85_05485 [Vibrio parahaemolyticus]|nr:hypothetical protein BS585_05770 [Vibrio parahaemolyticus]TOH39343.1 hypothetical protein CGI82_13435 [Vibrio parahaemolyticus]TOM10115.1 hypothetical protein CGH85_05485 [Vibrio parahaemolyticus]
MRAPRSLIQGEVRWVRWVWCFESASWVMCLQPSQKPKKPAVSTCWQSLWASRFLLFFLATPFYTVPRLVFRGRKHCTVRFVFKKFGD